MACVVAPSAAAMRALRLPTPPPSEPLELCRAVSDSIALSAGSGAAARRAADCLEEAHAASAESEIRTVLQAVLDRLEAAKDSLRGPTLAASSGLLARLCLRTLQSGTYHATRDLIGALLDTDVLAQLLVYLDILDFEARKDAMHVFAAVLQLGAPVGLKAQVVRHLEERPWIANTLLDGCCKPDISLHCGHMLRACSLYPELVKFLLEERTALRLLELAQHRSFDISSDAFASLRELLLVQKHVAVLHLSANFGEFFEAFNGLLLHEEYVTRRMALQLLGDIVEDPCFATVMCSYVGNERFLKLHMNLLLDTSAPIQLGAFRVLKAFLARPTKPPRVRQILVRNREQLVKLFESFPAPGDDDGAWEEQLRSALQTLEALQRPLADGLRRCIVEAQVRDALAVVQ